MSSSAALCVGAALLLAALAEFPLDGRPAAQVAQWAEAEYSGENPLNYAAEAYDAAWFLAKSIKSAGSADRTKIREGMKTVSGQKFTGALGENLVWKDQTIQVPGAAIQWTGTDEKLLYTASS